MIGGVESIDSSLSIHVLVPHGVNRKLIQSVGRVDLAYKMLQFNLK